VAQPFFHSRSYSPIQPFPSIPNPKRYHPSLIASAPIDLMVLATAGASGGGRERRRSRSSSPRALRRSCVGRGRAARRRLERRMQVAGSWCRRGGKVGGGCWSRAARQRRSGRQVGGGLPRRGTRHLERNRREKNNFEMFFTRR
jgi:hypothetical protein